MSEFERLLVATDFSAGSECATDAAIELAAAWGARIDWISVCGEAPHSLTPSSDALLAQWADHEQREAREGLDALQERASRRGIEGGTHIHAGRPDVVVAACAEETSSDLVVVGTHGRSGIQALLIGSVAEKIVRSSPVSVLCVRPGARGGAPIVYGEDFGDSGRREAAASLASSLGCPLVAVHGVELPGPVAADTSFSPPPALLDSTVEEARERMDQLAQQGAYGDGAETVVSIGPAASALCDQARRRNASLIITGTASRKGIERWMLGSVAERSLRSAPCSVLILK